MKIFLGKLLYKFGYAVYYIKWFATQPKTHGIQVVVRNGDSILFIQHTYMHHGLWDFPGGGIKTGEDPSQAAQRETEEELRIKVGELIRVGEIEVYHSHHHDNITVFEIKAQSQEIDFNQIEIKKVQWFNMNNLPSNLSRHTKAVLELYLKEKK